MGKIDLKRNPIWKNFGLIYGLIHLVFLFAVLVLIHESKYNLSFDPDIILLVFPVSGILAGYWIWKAKYGWRLFIIIPSFLIAGAVLFSAIFIAPKIDKVKQLKHEQLKPQKVQSDTDLKLFNAVADNNIIQLKQSLVEGADPNFADPESGMTPLFFAELEAAKILIDAGADIHARSNDKNTPLIWYTYSNHQKGIDYLLFLGADINAVNKDGKTALDIADHFGPPELIYFLKQKGALKE